MREVQRIVFSTDRISTWKRVARRAGFLAEVAAISFVLSVPGIGEAKKLFQSSSYNPKYPPAVVSEVDAKSLGDSAGARTKEFRALNYADYIRDVNATEAILNRYASQ